MSVLLFSEPGRSSALSRAVKAGRARRLAHGLYTSDLRTDPAKLLRREWLAVLGHHCPGAVIVDRSAVSSSPDVNGNLFVVHARLKPIAVPGLTIVPREGAPPLDDDIALPNGVWLSSRPRALLEN